MFEPRNVKSVKSRQDTISPPEEQVGEAVGGVPGGGAPGGGVASHFLVAPDRLDRATRRVIAPYAQIERRGPREQAAREGTYLDITRFNVFLEDSVDLDSLLYETAMVLKTVTNSSGVFVYIVNKQKNEIVLMPQNTRNPERHEVNIPIAEGGVAAAHVAATKEFLVLEDVARDRRFAEGLRWAGARVALCMPVVQPDGECYAVLELYRTHAEPYDNSALYSVVSVACWAGAAAHQAAARVALQRTAHLDSELRALLHRYFCDLASIDTMLTDMLAVVKTFLGAMRSSFYVVDRDAAGAGGAGGALLAEVWDDGWAAPAPADRTNMPRKKVKVDLCAEQTPAGLAARTGRALNVRDAYRDARFARDVDPATGTVARACLAAPIADKHGVIGVVQLTNKSGAESFTAEDEQIFGVFVSYCSLIVHFHHMHRQKAYHENLNVVYGELAALHVRACRHDLEDLMETNGIVMVPSNFKSFDFHMSGAGGGREDMPGLVVHMLLETFAETRVPRGALARFALAALRCYRDNPYHNAEHAFCFTHTTYLVLTANPGRLHFVETAALMLAGLCHDADHPGCNNTFLSLSRHPLAAMYRTSALEHHHYFLAAKLIQDNGVLHLLPAAEQAAVLAEVRYCILCTDLAVYFQLRAQLAPVLAERAFDWADSRHRDMLKGILMTTSDLSGSCKPFGVSKAIAESVYEEFYAQGDLELALGYSPLSMMDRRRRAQQPAEQIQFLSVVVLPCLALLRAVLPNTGPLEDNCRKTQEAWREEIEIRGQKLWRQDESLGARADR